MTLRLRQSHLNPREKGFEFDVGEEKSDDAYWMAV